jgi:glycerol-3-phosphate dehydrogenase (NAD(P)+)
MSFRYSLGIVVSVAGSSSEKSSKIAILGAGSWGSTLAKVFAAAGKDVALWTRDEKKADEINQTRRVEKPLRVEFPATIFVTADLEKCLDNREIIILACTSQSVRSLAQLVKAHLSSNKPVVAGRSSQPEQKEILVNVAKGLELESFLRMSQILEEFFPAESICSLSGPNLAFEILHGLPTASVIACKDDKVAKHIQSQLTIPTLRMYSNTDITGVELGGAFKNVIAIAAGALDELNLGTNAKAALLTRGLAEMTRIAVTMGAKASTMSGLAGLGDLMATCSSDLSRNYRLGKMIAHGVTVDSALGTLGAVAEGVNTANAVCHLGEKMNVELPIALQVETALKGEISPQKAIMNLMNRPLISE